jgi:hypothetical protein
MGAQLADDLGAELEPAVLLVLGVVLDQEPAALGMELRVDLDDRTAHGQDPGPEVKVRYPKLGQLTPPQAALDVGLDQQLRLRVGKRRVEHVELLGRDDRPSLTAHRQKSGFQGRF